MNSPQDVKNWYLNDSFNSKVSPGNQTNYRLACVISPSTATLLSFYQQPNSIYLGSNLDVLVSSTETKYKLLYYSYVYDASQKKYLVGRSTFTLKNFTVDYKPYLTSSNYIFIAVGIPNIDNTSTYFTQAVKQDNYLSSLTINVAPQNYTYSSNQEILTNNKRNRYYANTVLTTSSYSQTPAVVFNYLSRTPSTTVFANELLKTVKPV